MAILRKAQCDICGKEEYERGPGKGWNGWIIIQGVVLDGVDNPIFCEECRDTIMGFVDGVKHPIADIEADFIHSRELVL